MSMPGIGNFGWLLATLTFCLLIVPVTEHWAAAGLLVRLGLTSVTWGAFAAVARRRGPALAIAVLLLLAGAAIWGTAAAPWPWLDVAGYVFNALVFASTAGIVLAAVVRRHLATMQSIFGVISAYLLLGLSWSMLYASAAAADGNAFSETMLLPDEGMMAVRVDFARLIYYSFVTMSTVGFGDIAPRSDVACTLSWLQSVTGMFYTAVVVGLVVSEFAAVRGTRLRDAA